MCCKERLHFQEQEGGLMFSLYKAVGSGCSVLDCFSYSLSSPIPHIPCCLSEFLMSFFTLLWSQDPVKWSLILATLPNSVTSVNGFLITQINQHDWKFLRFYWKGNL